MNKPNDQTIAAYFFLELWLAHAPRSVSVGLAKLPPAKCPLPRQSSIVTDYGTKCGEDAPVQTLVPITDRNTGERGLMTHQVCVHHSLTIACFKFIEMVMIAGRKKAIVVAG